MEEKNQTQNLQFLFHNNHEKISEKFKDYFEKNIQNTIRHKNSEWLLSKEKLNKEGKHKIKNKLIQILLKQLY
jgi:tryptophan synthase beta subunit